MADNEFTADLVTIEDEDGVTHTFEELDRIETDDGKYLALTPVYDDAEEILDGDGELIIVKVMMKAMTFIWSLSKIKRIRRNSRNF